MSQMGLGGHGNTGVGDAGGQFTQGVARTEADDQQVQQPLGPDGFRPFDRGMTRWSQIRPISRIRSWALPKRVSGSPVHSETMGTTFCQRTHICSKADIAFAQVHKDLAYGKSNGPIFQGRPSFPDLCQPCYSWYS